MSDPTSVVTINGKTYETDKLSDTAKSLITVFNSWQKDRTEAFNELNKAKLELAKCEAALRDLSAEIVTVVETPPAV